MTIIRVEDDPLPAEGHYLAEVASCEVAHSKKGGHAMLLLTFKSIPAAERLCEDVVMLGGTAKGIGKKKLLLLGAVANKPGPFEVDSDRLIGLRCYLWIKHETYNGEVRAKVDNAKHTEFGAFGYEPDSAAGSATTEFTANEIPATPFD
jgi:hypothetical protein